MKCKTCSRRFRLLAKNRYEIVKQPVGFEALTKDVTYYNAFDCPHCGCQNIVGIVEKDGVVSDEKKVTDDEIN